VKNNRKIEVGQVREVGEPTINMCGWLYVVTSLYFSSDQHECMWLSGECVGEKAYFTDAEVAEDIVVM
tara:strand:- start:275 stop:478 length:204 start_codon:yes stop_codon:yes gene_type:complete